MFKLKKLALTLSLILSLSVIPLNTFANGDTNTKESVNPIPKTEQQTEPSSPDNDEDKDKKDQLKDKDKNKSEEKKDKSTNLVKAGTENKNAPEIKKNIPNDYKSVRISNVRVYNDRVEGYAENATKVTLYKNGNDVGTSRYINNGDYFSISYDFVNKNYNYNTKRVNPNWSGYGSDAENYNYVVAVKNGTVEAYTTVKNGNYNFDNLKLRATEYTYYATNSKDYYSNGYDFQSLRDFQLKAESRYDSTSYKLSNADDKRDKSFYSSYAKSVSILSAEANSYSVKGYGADSYAKITVRDSNNNILGTTTADYRGDFSVNTNRALKSGETLTINSSANFSKENSTKYTVSGKSSKTSYTNLFTIDSKSLSVTKNGITTTTSMDVAPYIKDGRTMLPLRYVAESLGYNVIWNSVTRIAAFSNSDTLILINIDSSDFTINGKKYTFSVKPEIKNDRINLPVAEIGKALGLTTGLKGEGKNIEWDSVNRTVKITLN